MPEVPPKSSAQTVERAIAILNLFRDDQVVARYHVDRQADRTQPHDRPPVGAHAGARAVHGAGPGERAVPTGSGARRARPARRRGLGIDRAGPTIDRLSQTTGESVSVGVRGSGGVMVVAQSSSRHALRFEHPAGGAIDVHASAMGKVLLAFGETPPSTTVAELGRLARFTASTITTRRRSGHRARARPRRRIRHQSPGAL